MKLIWGHGFAEGECGQSAMGICALFYIYRSAKFGVAVFKASMLNWGVGVNLPWVYIHCSIYIDLPSLV